MSKWVGSVTPNNINLTRVGGDNVLKLLVLAAAVALPVTITVAWATQIEIALTILATIGLIAVLAKPVYVLATDITWPWEARKVRAFTAQVDAAFAHRAAMELEPVAPLRVAAERVHELEAPAPVVDLHVNRDALEA